MRGKVVNQYKVAKHFELAIDDKSFTFARRNDAIAAEAALDGIIIRTSVDAQRMQAADCVRNVTTPSAKQRRALELIQQINV